MVGHGVGGDNKTSEGSHLLPWSETIAAMA